MIECLKDLESFMKLHFMEKAYPKPPRGSGEDVAEIHNTYSWTCVLKAAKALTQSELNEVINFRQLISFHNNSMSGHGSVGQSWTIGYFLDRNGDPELRNRIKKLGMTY